MSKIFEQRVIKLMMQHPEGLSSYEIYNKLADEPRNSRWLPSRNTIGSKLSGIVGLQKIDTATGYSSILSRSVAVWQLDIERYNTWRGIE